MLMGAYSARPAVRGGPDSLGPAGTRCIDRGRWLETGLGSAAANVREVRLLLCSLVALACTDVALGGGIADEPCPNAHGEHTNTCAPGTVGAPYAVRFVETEGSGCGPGRQTFHFDSGELPPGLSLAPDGVLSGFSTEAGAFQFYVEMREPQNDPANCAGKRTQKQFTVMVREKPWIDAVPSTAPAAEVGVPFRIRLRARGGSGVFRWRPTVGSLPTGVNCPFRRCFRSTASSSARRSSTCSELQEALPNQLARQEPRRREGKWKFDGRRAGRSGARQRV